METGRQKWDRKIRYVAARLASDDGLVFEELPATSRWFASQVRYTHRAATACGAANIWDAMDRYKDTKGGE